MHTKSQGDDEDCQPRCGPCSQYLMPSARPQKQLLRQSFKILKHKRVPNLSSSLPHIDHKAQGLKNQEGNAMDMMETRHKRIGNVRSNRRLLSYMRRTSVMQQQWDNICDSKTTLTQDNINTRHPG